MMVKLTMIIGRLLYNVSLSIFFLLTND